MSTTAAPCLDRHATDSSKAASALFERHRPRVLAFCLSRTRNRSDAEDATQTTFMYALSGLRRGVVPEFELTWLLRIAENVCHSQRRRAHRRYEREALPVDVTGDSRGDPAVISERLETIASALEQLPEAQRRAIVLREWRGLSYHDIAAELRTSHAAVETLLFRARRSLAERVASTGAAALELVRLGRWVLAGGAGKAAVVGATAATVVVGVAGERPAAAVHDPGPARIADGAARVDAGERIRPKVFETDRVARATSETTVPANVPEVETAAGAPKAALPDKPRTPEPGGPTQADASSSSSGAAAARADVIDVVPRVDLDHAIEGVEAVLEPVGAVPLELVPALEPAVPEVQLPDVEVVDELPAVAPNVPRLPLPSLTS